MPDVHTTPEPDAEHLDVVAVAKALNFEAGSYVVVGSGLMGALNIRASRDVDMVVSRQLYERLQTDGWQQQDYEAGFSTLTNGTCEAFLDWDGTYEQLDLAALLAEGTTEIDGVAFATMSRVKRWKERAHRDKDSFDLELIAEYERVDE